MSDEKKFRKHETSIEIAAPAAEVWKAITDAEAITRWFAPQAKVEPGAGGSIWVSWGPGMEGTARIEIWEPNRHLRTSTERPPSSCATEVTPASDAEAATPVRVSVDYQIEAKGGTTVLRLVHSGFGEGSGWDQEYESTKRGWPMFFRVLKHGLERHPNQKARQASTWVISPLGAEESWAKLMGPAGLLAKGSLNGLRAGSRYSFETATGDRLEGAVQVAEFPGYFAATIENWNDALLTVFCEKVMDAVVVTIGTVLYGAAAAQADDRNAAWTGLLEKLFPQGQRAAAVY